MAATLRLPFQLNRPDSSTPVTLANCVDITTISGISATNVQNALAELASRSSDGYVTLSQMEDYELVHSQAYNDLNSKILTLTDTVNTRTKWK